VFESSIEISTPSSLSSPSSLPSPSSITIYLLYCFKKWHKACYEKAPEKNSDLGIQREIEEPARKPVTDPEDLNITGWRRYVPDDSDDKGYKGEGLNEPKR
jgi:hypothetical protein